jgi:hypothetical protein
MPSAYLESTDYAAYGVPNATAAQVQWASALIDGYLARREGLVYEVDGFGNPCAMVAPAPTYQLAAQAAFGPSPTTAITINVSGPVNRAVNGEVLIVDRGLSTEEALVIQVSPTPFTNSPNGLGNAQWGNGGNQIQAVNPLGIAGCNFAHASGALLQAGLTIKEEHPMPSDRPLATLYRTPVASVLSGQGRYGYGRRGNTQFYAIQQFNLLNMLQGFTGPPLWEQFQVNINNCDPERGTFWAPSGIFLAYYSRVRIWYVAGFTYSDLPSVVKQACAQLVLALQQYPEMSAGNMKSLAAGQNNMQRFTASLLDEDTKRMLNFYRARIV